jgi:hypothetical protein
MALALIALLSATVGPFAARAAPRGKDTPGETLYFPTAVGTKWVYQSADKFERAEEVMAVEEKDGAFRVTVGRVRGGELAAESLVSVSAAGLSVLTLAVADLTEPLVLLRLPHAAGNNWEPALAGKPWGRVVGTAVADGPDRIEVPAGVYQAIRVRTEIPFIDGRKGKGLAKKTVWYAPGVGVVKEVDGDDIQVLKTFTPGKK